MIINFIKKHQNKCSFTSEEILDLHKMKEIVKKINIDKDIEYLLIKRKNSLNYVEFIRGKYDINNIDYLEKSINFITVYERDKIKKNDFNFLWKDLWGEIDCKKNSSEFNDAQYKFNLLKKGFYLKKNEMTIQYSLTKILNNTIYAFNEPEWGFPKGRRNEKEKNIECAKREFEEETNLKTDEYTIINISPLEETYLASNNLKYKHIYYISQIKDNMTNLILNTNNKSQMIEIGDIQWKTFKNSLNTFRDYNIEKKNILLNLHMNLKYIFDTFNLI